MFLNFCFIWQQKGDRLQNRHKKWQKSNYISRALREENIFEEGEEITQVHTSEPKTSSHRLKYMNGDVTRPYLVCQHAKVAY